MRESRDWDWLVFNKKKFIGGYLVQFKKYRDSETLHDISKIVDITMSDFAYFVRTEKCGSFAYQHDVELPDLMEDDDNLIMDDRISEIRCIFLKPKPQT